MMENPLETTRYVNLVENLNRTLNYVNKYLDLKIKALHDGDESSTKNYYTFTVYVNDEIYKQKVGIEDLDDEIVKIVHEYVGIELKIHWILDSKRET